MSPPTSAEPTAVGGRTPALLLGSIGDKPRRSISEPLVLELDFSAPLAPGTLELRNANNTLVRTIVTPASADGSLRLVWDVRDDKGEPVYPTAVTPGGSGARTPQAGRWPARPRQPTSWAPSTSRGTSSPPPARPDT
ncbi:FlgD immunoglobulin-like domain containing protein [Tessaracoccus antarcticus]|uniref:FlgD immunoglobulin-like domain containing protein n=1 Tax=Tessaracoccus antarcticus TaxID=2479848 RepID=UPI00389A6DCF